jgi:hypothetical protein
MASGAALRHSHVVVLSQLNEKGGVAKAKGKGKKEKECTTESGARLKT